MGKNNNNDNNNKCHFCFLNQKIWQNRTRNVKNPTLKKLCIFEVIRRNNSDKTSSKLERAFLKPSTGIKISAQHKNQWTLTIHFKESIQYCKMIFYQLIALDCCGEQNEERSCCLEGNSLHCHWLSCSATQFLPLLT